MTRRIIIRLEAESDIIDATLWYEDQEPDLGLDLISEVHSAIIRAQTNPESFMLLRRDPPIRRVLLNGSLSRFFIVRPDAIVVFSVLHASRHDRAWKDRATLQER